MMSTFSLGSFRIQFQNSFGKLTLYRIQFKTKLNNNKPFHRHFRGLDSLIAYFLLSNFISHSHLKLVYVCLFRQIVRSSVDISNATLMQNTNINMKTTIREMRNKTTLYNKINF